MKRILQIVLGLVYLVAILISLIVLIKPGASIFYKKFRIESQSLIQYGNAYEYQFRINYQFYNPNSILILEDEKILGFATPEYTRTAGSGTFALKHVGGNHVTVLFAPTNFSDPFTSGHDYHIYIRPHLISSETGKVAFPILMLGLIAFLGSILINTHKRKVLFGSPVGVVKLWCDTCDKVAWKIKLSFGLSAIEIKHSAINIILLAYFYVFMEWIFLVTKPSFMELLGLGEKTKIFYVTGLAAAMLSLLMLPVIFLLDIILTPPLPSYRKYAYHFPAAFMAICLCLILIDNFTYTILKFGIVNTTTWMRVFYAIITAGIFVLILRKMAAAKKTTFVQGSFRVQTRTAIGLIAGSLILAVISFNPGIKSFTQDEISAGAVNKPNIILLGSDGLNAENMSVYGYERNTTPFIEQLAKTSLFSENNFTNAANSTGSDTALLTGKLPFTTHVLYPPDTLKGSDMYQHLPGLLKNNGYRTVSLGVPYYVDANTINFQNAFDAVNCQENSDAASASYLSGFGYADEIYLLTTIEERIGDRLKHIFFIQDMQNPYAIVTQVEPDGITDRQRMDCLRTYLDEVRQNGQPLFAHLHLIGTHGASFAPELRVFSKDEIQTDVWMTDFYDDAVLNFDNEVKQLVQYLKEHGQFDNTILVLYTDHGQKYVTTAKVPLIIHFPIDHYAGTITASTQIIDVAPTILEYMGIQIPEWMEGDSLLSPLESKRLIIAGLSSQKEKIGSGIFTLSKEAIKPPFYQFSQLSVIQCQNWYLLNLTDLTMSEGVVEDYVKPCPPSMLDSTEVIREKAGGILEQLGYILPVDW